MRTSKELKQEIIDTVVSGGYPTFSHYVTDLGKSGVIRYTTFNAEHTTIDSNTVIFRCYSKIDGFISVTVNSSDFTKSDRKKKLTEIFA